jgi:hypothetical protein
MKSNQKKIYINYLDGVHVFIPVDAIELNNNEYEIQNNEDFDYEDNSILFEFGPGDIVKLKMINSNSGKIEIANELIKNGDKRNIGKRFLYYLSMDIPIENHFTKEIINNLIKEIPFEDWIYPAARERLNKLRKQTS